jgi:DNA-binding beta-propeller fold protein YncE
VADALVRISDNGHTVTTLPVTDLYQPTGLAVSADGTVYVSNYGDGNTTSAQAGEIVKITGLS